MLNKILSEHYPSLFDNIYFGENTNFFPKNKIKKVKDGYILQFALPGLKKEDINIKVENDIISISYNEENEINEFAFTNSFNKQYKLSSDLDSDKIKAKVENGILTIDIPFKEELKTEKIIEIN